MRATNATDPIHAALVKAIERKETSYLWTPGDTKPFIPRVLPHVFGDGRALFTLSTLNQRPMYWVIRGCSSWDCSDGYHSDERPDFGDFTDEILTELEEAFGRGRCGYSGNDLFLSKRERIADCQCEECSDGSFRARWPMVDDDGGCSWGRMKWPDGFAVEAHPFSRRGNLLRATPSPALEPAKDPQCPKT